jgi:hypothetical protein
MGFLFFGYIEENLFNITAFGYGRLCSYRFMASNVFRVCQVPQVFWPLDFLLFNIQTPPLALMRGSGEIGVERATNS